MALFQSTPVSVTTDVFQEGDIKYEHFPFPDKTKKSTTPSPPKPLLIFTPTVPDLYPVILFCHGFFLRNSFYEKLLGHIASHGFIVVAPQIYEPPCYMRGPKEVYFAGSVANWIADNLQSELAENLETKDVKANLEQFVVAGHSRGGKVAFCVALGYAQTKLKPSVLVGIDPVAGVKLFGITMRTYPEILECVPGPFNLGIPVAVIGTGLGPEPASMFIPIPCAPDGLNHKEFFKKCKPPCAHFVAKDYGHMDMLDDNKSECTCKNGTCPRDLMRRTVGGLVVAFLRAFLNGQRKDLDVIVHYPHLAPANLHPVEYIPE